ncbi:hypothetical protein GIB67_001682 [Kingdonia uniflora]|uniref:Uncharacterized protein n=1 Tax=Kingdonia uniflora TaxID=39325 RepID=A0A7J7LMW3_9MAGN|nr:hypothetical protein GIB67_001682 [Kingdonia uniflora]
MILASATVISVTAMLSREDLEILRDKFGWKDCEVEDYIEHWIEQELENDEFILLWREANEVWILNRHGTQIFLCLKGDLTREAFQMLENFKVKKDEFQTSIDVVEIARLEAGVVTKDSKKFDRDGLKMKCHEETTEREAHRVIDLAGGKDRNMSTSFRSKSDEEVAILMREVHTINDSNCQEDQSKKTSPNPKPLPRIRKTNGEELITSLTTDEGSPVELLLPMRGRSSFSTLEITEAWKTKPITDPTVLPKGKSEANLCLFDAVLNCFGTIHVMLFLCLCYALMLFCEADSLKQLNCNALELIIVI